MSAPTHHDYFPPLGAYNLKSGNLVDSDAANKSRFNTIVEAYYPNSTSNNVFATGGSFEIDIRDSNICLVTDVTLQLTLQNQGATSCQLVDKNLLFNQVAYGFGNSNTDYQDFGETLFFNYAFIDNDETYCNMASSGGDPNLYTPYGAGGQTPSNSLSYGGTGLFNVGGTIAPNQTIIVNVPLHTVMERCNYPLYRNRTVRITPFMTTNPFTSTSNLQNNLDLQLIQVQCLVTGKVPTAEGKAILDSMLAGKNYITYSYFPLRYVTNVGTSVSSTTQQNVSLSTLGGSYCLLASYIRLQNSQAEALVGQSYGNTVSIDEFTMDYSSLQQQGRPLVTINQSRWPFTGMSLGATYFNSKFLTQFRYLLYPFSDDVLRSINDGYISDQFLANNLQQIFTPNRLTTTRNLELVLIFYERCSLVSRPDQITEFNRL
jgi:hypothetical protein